MGDKIAIKVENVNKTFKLPHEKTTSVKSAVINFYRHKRTFEKQQVLKNISFEIKKGEFFGIVGRNGSGKSTLLKLLAGIYAPDSGKIEVNGKLTPFIELGVGFNPELTGRENVYLNGALLGFNRREMDELYDDIVEFAELEQFMDQKLKNYSSGMQVRLAFSIAIRARSDILLIDEVLAVGDALFQRKCFEYFSDLKRRGTTVIFVSHDVSSLLRYCDKGILIDDGDHKVTGDIKKVVDEYRQLLMAHEEGRARDSKKEKRPVTIERCRVLDVQGKEKKKFETGEDITLEIVLKASSNIKNPINIAAGIYNGYYGSDGVYNFGASTQLDEFKIPASTPKVLLEIKKPVMKNGVYWVYIAVFDQSEEVPYDYAPEVASFTISGAPELKSRGAIMAKYNWSFK